jgi:hypothetical protein
MHTPTPWTDNIDNNVTDSEGNLIARLEYGGWFLTNAENNAKRIVACVNACEPFKDPLESIPKLLVEVEALRDRVKELEGNNIIYQNSSFEKPKTKEELAEDWRESKTDDEWIALLKKYNHYGYDRGIILDELIEMWELEN